MGSAVSCGGVVPAVPGTGLPLASSQRGHPCLLLPFATDTQQNFRLLLRLFLALEMRWKFGTKNPKHIWKENSYTFPYCFRKTECRLLPLVMLWGSFVYLLIDPYVSNINKIDTKMWRVTLTCRVFCLVPWWVLKMIPIPSLTDVLVFKQCVQYCLWIT